MHEILTQIATIGVKPLTSIIVQRVTTQPRLSLHYVVYNSACTLPQSGACGGRGDIKRENCSVTFPPVKKQRINAKIEPSKCSGLAISRHRQIYALIGVELRTRGRFSSNLVDGSPLCGSTVSITYYDISLLQTKTVLLTINVLWPYHARSIDIIL